MNSSCIVLFLVVVFSFQAAVSGDAENAEDSKFEETLRIKRAITEAKCHAAGLTLAKGKEVKAATELIRFWKTSGKIPPGTHVSSIVEGRNIAEYKATAKKRGFAEFIPSARIDNQGEFTEGGVKYSNLQLQLKNKSYACVLLKVGVSKTEKQMRSAFNKSLNECIKVKLV